MADCRLTTIGNFPVSRFGMIAQKVNEKSIFIIDGMASHGNSGSPVFDISYKKFLATIYSISYI